MASRIAIDEPVLLENDRLAAGLRARLAAHRVVALNLVSSPGAGKTALLERTIGALGTELRLALIAGDIQTENDAARLAAAGGRTVRPIVTGGACHLDAGMVTSAVADVGFGALDLLLIENVGNLVCPSGWDLGEDLKVVLISTTEGDDKPLKYPGIFRRAGVMIVNKLDLLGRSDFRLEAVRENALRINDALEILVVSCREGTGLEAWYDWLRARVRQKKLEPPSEGG